ncbi:MAG TPA: MFS transporter [Propionicimonas sp.]|nr:MFS transporter [Propionicimonas sp.]
MTDARPARVSARHWMVVIGSGLLMSMNVLLFLAAGVMLPPLAETLGVGLGQVMVFISLYMVAGAVVVTVAGPFLIRRFGTRRLAITGGAFTGAMLFSVCFVTDLLQLYLLAFASGLMATVSMQMTGAVLVSEWFVRHRGLMQGVLMGIAGMGGIGAGVLLPPVMDAGGWRLGFQAVGAVTLVVAVLCGALLIRTRPADVGLHPYGEHEAGTEEGIDEAGMDPAPALRSPQFVALVIGLTCFSGIMSLQQHFPSMMADRGLDLVAAGSLLSILSVVNVGTTLLLGKLSDRLGPLIAYALSGGLLVAALTMFLLTMGYPAQATAVLLFAIPTITPPILTPILLRHTFGGRAFVSLLGVGTATMPAGIAIGSPLWGLAKDTTGSYGPALAVAIGLAVACVALVSYALITGPRRWLPAAERQGQSAN